MIVSAVMLGVFLSLAGLALVSQAAPKPPLARKIVVFDEKTFVNEEVLNGLLKKFDAQALKKLPLINGVVVWLPLGAERALASQAGVLRIDNDDIVFALGKPFCNNNGVCEPNLGENPSCADCKNGEEEPPPPPPPQEMDWGVNRIDADLAWATSTGWGVKVAILDTGIDIDHPDLSVAGGVNVLGPFRKTAPKDYNDDNGHGTHVAGIVAALDNTVGVVGVAPNAQLYAVKAFNRQAIGFVSDIVDGIDWCLNNPYGRMDVINMSFGESGDNASLHQAIETAYQAGIVMVAAAGNDGDDFIYYPARYSQTIAVSATCSALEPGTKYKCDSSVCIMDGEDGLASFSSYATDVAQAQAIHLIAAPGQNIMSTWNDGNYYAGNGTSMATPHIVGTAALLIASGVTGTSQVMAILENTAEDLGATGTDSYFGYGLVDAEKAVNATNQ